MSNIPITVCGTVATAPQARTLPTGRPCASFRLAVNHWRVDKQTGEFVSDTTSWFGVDCYGSLASNVGSSVTLGMSVVIQGHLRIREWESQERSGIAPTIIADHLGPDLRFGTANYVKAQGTASGRQSAPAQEAEGSGSGWDALPRENTGAAGRTDSFERSPPGVPTERAPRPPVTAPRRRATATTFPVTAPRRPAMPPVGPPTTPRQGTVSMPRGQAGTRRGRAAHPRAVMTNPLTAMKRWQTTATTQPRSMTTTRPRASATTSPVRPPPPRHRSEPLWAGLDRRSAGTRTTGQSPGRGGSDRPTAGTVAGTVDRTAAGTPTPGRSTRQSPGRRGSGRR
ncbi:single-stranded DNA-binding protein [Brevibacterium casei]|nr:single-stranded DNA-binding protein [Brevibacterium casei]